MTYSREEFERDQMGQTGDDLRQKATTPADPTPTLLTMLLEEWKRTDMPARRVWDEIAAQAALVQRLTRELDSVNARFCVEHRGVWRSSNCVACSVIAGGETERRRQTEIRQLEATIARLTAELARAQDTVRRDTETMAAERDAVTPVNFAAIAATLKAECERQHAEVMRLTAVIRPLWDEAGKILGNPEDCDDCGALDEEGPCRVHGTSGNALYRACQAAAEVLGPCVCGHPASGHEDCDSTHCKTCKCEAFTLPPVDDQRLGTTETP